MCLFLMVGAFLAGCIVTVTYMMMLALRAHREDEEGVE